MCSKIPRLDLDTLEPIVATWQLRHPNRMVQAQAELDRRYLADKLGLCHNQDPLTLAHCEGCDYVGSVSEAPDRRENL